MADIATASEVQINVKGPNELKLLIPISTDKTVLDLKQAIADRSDVPADRQRLTYSGRVLKDGDILAVYNIQPSHTVHMVAVTVATSTTSSTSTTTTTTSTSTTTNAGTNTTTCCIF
ncbi:ubiquitin-related domain-containing protein [Cytidiella melzeri]|nr:ubiquitin-related domain-containing protein [Cytidiella melzeri]